MFPDMTKLHDSPHSRRAFLEAAGLTAAATAAAPSLAAGLPGHLPQDTARLNLWLRGVTAAAIASPRATGPNAPSVQALADLIDRDGIVRMYVTQMVEQVPSAHRTVGSISDLLASLNHIVQTAPAYSDDPSKRNTFPMSALFVYMMYTTAGRSAFTNAAFNNAIRGVLQEWCTFLDSPASCSVLNTSPRGWLSPGAVKLNKLDEFVIPDRSAPHWGFPSWNAYFHRQIKGEVRPLAGAGDAKVIVSANDGTVNKIARNVQRTSKFWMKSQPYSLADMLDHHDLVDRFVGGDVFQSFLSGADYHRWRSPVAGRVIDTRIVDGLMFSELESVGYDASGGTWSQEYEAQVNTRGLVFIECDDPSLGVVVVIPIGITEISSVTIGVTKGDQVGKGEELGYFSYGGSSMCLVFEPGVIKSFSVPAPAPGSDPDGGPKIKVRGEIAQAN